MTNRHDALRVSALDIKELIIQVADLEDYKPEDIDDDEQLFGGRIGLDSIDALEIGLALSERYHIGFDARSEDFYSSSWTVSTLVAFLNRRDSDTLERLRASRLA